ncbi:hypothetical protein [Synechococcus sp. PCC 6312]|uniref:hypothetical protein n=1 Tax=Synechococcus sp. (strain ATCC 27167 / PCC 6312) TaxID=195253 RepID=UPI00029F1789|nr:hypothetical protein [Synechococcus sp. PCC 6312]AFY61846.1 hypothetical protein Syn6312_2766 [Synechococcus sp. PCC 6312]
MKTIEEFEAEIKEKHCAIEVEKIMREYAKSCLESNRLNEYHQLIQKLKEQAIQKIQDSENLFHESIRLRNSGNIDGILAIQLKKALKIFTESVKEEAI